MTIVRVRQATVQKSKSQVPLTVEWNSARMIRIHSINAAVDEIINATDSLDVVKVNIVGQPSTGKSVLAATLAHIIHKRSKIPFAVKLFTRDDLKNFSEVLKTLNAMNHVLIFDDISFLKADLSSKQISNIEKEFTMIRHLEGGKDVKIIAIFNSHYTVAISKYLRQSDFHFYTTAGSSDIDHLTKLMGRKYLYRISSFQKTSLQAMHKKSFSYMLSKKKKSKFTYTYRKPFAPVLFFNGFAAREVVFPKRDWVDKYCMTCEAGSGGATQDQASLEKFDAAAKTKFGPRVIMQALRLLGAINGIYVHQRRVRQAATFIEKWQAQHHVNLADMLKFYNINNYKTELVMNAAMKKALEEGDGDQDGGEGPGEAPAQDEGPADGDAPAPPIEAEE